jgi:phosphohistidine swiveling domain-containing protein
MIIIPFTSPEATLDTAGGKGANLARLTRAGFDVPPGFIISTEAYRAFVQENYLQTVILSALENLAEDDTSSLEGASSGIRAAFSAGKMTAETESTIRAAYGNLPHPTPLSLKERGRGEGVAVRSSATAEDLPDLSFAGQQDTFLNIIGEGDLFRAVVNCWSSLWTARAIGYRMRNHIPHTDAALAVVVQEMIQSEVSGVLFTANPLTGLLSESVIDATFGLGEALVSGQVEPDHFVVDTASGAITGKTLGAKRISTRGKAGGGVETIVENAAARQTLFDADLRQLVILGSRIQIEYGSPQDIEWALGDGKFYILQSRAITTLFPLPQERATHASPMQIWFSFGAVQGVLAPLTPLGSDTFRCVFSGGARMFDVHVAYDEQKVLVPAGQRLWIKVSDFLRHPLGRRVSGALLGYIEPSIRQILRGLANEPQLGAGQGRFRLSTVLRLMRFALPILVRFVRNIHNPEKARADFDALIKQELEKTQVVVSGDIYDHLAQRLDFMMTRMTNAFPTILPRFIPLFGPGIGMLNLLTKLTTESAGTDHGLSMLVLDVMRGLPNNVTTEMDLALWDTSKQIRADADSLEGFTSTDAPALAAHYLAGTLPEAAQKAIAAFLSRYGMRGVGEIDIGQPRWSDDPTPIMQTLQSYLQITDPDAAPDVQFARGQKTAEKAIEQLAATARKQRGGFIKERLVRFAARRIRVLMGAREAPKFYAVRMIGIVRQELLESGRELVEAGVFDQVEDIFFLSIHGLEALSRKESRDWKAIIAGHRVAYDRESRRRQIPRVLVSDGRAFYEGIGAETDMGDVITGSPVSAGVVEGVVHVVFDPGGTQLIPGEILVCPGTDPAWTPLFLAAGGLVMEVGGMMTHGSVVAREYGIPAVVGVHRATTRLKNGQRIRLDGTRGKIQLLE